MLIEDIRERIFVGVAAIPLACVLSILMRAGAHEFHITTPGMLFLGWYVPSYAGWTATGPARVYELSIDVCFCYVIVLVLYWFVQKRFYSER